MKKIKSKILLYPNTLHRQLEDEVSRLVGLDRLGCDGLKAVNLNDLLRKSAELFISMHPKEREELFKKRTSL